jgi:hypothetical protein
MKKDTPISLFSFQDIITCLTGIMIVVVLIILLQLVEAMTKHAAASPLAEEVKELRQREKELAAVRDSLLSSGESIDEEVRQYAAFSAEELKMMLEEYADKLKAKDEEMKKRIRRIEKSLTLYKEIKGCHQALDRLRRNLLYSQYLSLTEKYTIYSRAQIICYDIVTRISDIDQLVNDIKQYKYTPSEQDSKEPKLDKTIAIVREIRARIGSMEQMSIDLINHKRSLVNTDAMMRKNFNVKLY